MPPFDIHTKSPDAGHEAIRVAVIQAIADLATNQADVADSFLLADTLFTLVDQTFADMSDSTTERGQLRQRITVLEGQVADLLTRVAALEQPTP